MIAVAREPASEASVVADGERTLPLFPLNTVLFPGLPLPLHIFEERYKLMIATCLVTDSEFGVTLIRAGVEVGGPAEPHEIGTIARILEVDRLPDGRMNIVTVGTERFRLTEVVEREPYLVGRVAPLPSGHPDADPDLTSDVRDKFLAYLRTLRPELAERAPTKLADEPEALSFQLAAALPIVPDRRQTLLAMDSAAERLRALRSVIQREHQTLLLAGRGAPAKSIGPFSIN
jgi:uncharacterized protein